MNHTYGGSVVMEEGLPARQDKAFLIYVAITKITP